MKKDIPITLLICAALIICASSAGGSVMRGQSPVDGYDTPAPPKRFYQTEPGYKGIQDQMHNEFMRNEAYATADGMLNETWELCKKSFSGAEYERLLASQRNWLNYGRDDVAQQLMRSQPPVQAYTQAIMDRVASLARMVATPPRPGRYETSNGYFVADIKGDRLILAGTTAENNYICEFSGSALLRNGWLSVNDNEVDNFYILFTGNQATIYYYGSRNDCGHNGYFNSTYQRVR